MIKCPSFRFSHSLNVRSTRKEPHLSLYMSDCSTLNTPATYKEEGGFLSISVRARFEALCELYMSSKVNLLLDMLQHANLHTTKTAPISQCTKTSLSLSWRVNQWTAKRLACCTHCDFQLFKFVSLSTIVAFPLVLK